MNRGYIRLWRKSLDAGWIRNHKLWTFWTYCLMKASYKEFDAVVGLQVVHLIPGQFIFGRKKAAEETGLTEREIRTIIDCLKKAENMTIKTTNKFSIISIINWSIYQGDETENDQLNDQPLSSKGPHTNIKELKNNKTFLSDSIEIRLSELLLEKILYRIPGFKKPNIQTWAKDIDLMVRIDNRAPDDIREVISWCQTHSFWQRNILSAGKLRKQYDQLRANMGENSRPGSISCPVSQDAFKCPRCSRRIVVKADLTNGGCVYCEFKHKEVTA